MDAALRIGVGRRLAGVSSRRRSAGGGGGRAMAAAVQATVEALEGRVLLSSSLDLLDSPSTRPENVWEGYSYGGLTATSVTSVVIPGVPAYEWHDGCAPTSGGMLMGYWDQHGFGNLVNGDVSNQGSPTDHTTAVNVTIASLGHYNDYALPIDDMSLIPIKDKSEGTAPVHANNSVADYMHTSRSVDGLTYGGTWPDMVGTGLTGYAAYRGYSRATASYSPYSGLSWLEFKANIDANEPVVIGVDSNGDGYADHAIAGIGYDDSTQRYACYNTWDTDVHWFDWAPVAAGREFGVEAVISFRPGTLVSLGSIGGMAWTDGNQDNMRNPGEAGRAGVQVELFSSTDAVVGNDDDVRMGTLLTGSDGRYEFGYLAPGNYYLSFDTLTGDAMAVANQGGDDTTDSDPDPGTGLTGMLQLGDGEVVADCDLGVQGQNMAPVAIVPAPQTINEDTVLQFARSLGNAITVTDPDAGMADVQVTLTTTEGLVSLGNPSAVTPVAGTGENGAYSSVTFQGSIFAVNMAMDGMVFTPTANYNGQASVLVTVNDLAHSGTGGPLTDVRQAVVLIQPVNDQDMRLDMVGCWRFDENGGTSAADDSFSGNSATLMTPAQFMASDRPGGGNSVHLDGQAGYVAIGSVPALNVAAGLGVSVWVKAESWSGSPVILQKGSGEKSQYRLAVSNGALVFSLSGGRQVAAALPSTGAWHSIIGTYSDGMMHLFVDGVLAAGAQTSGGIGQTNGPLFVGTSSNSAPADAHFNGQIDDVRVYARQFTVADVRWLSGTTVGVLTVNGGSDNDTILVSQAGDQLQVSVNGDTQIFTASQITGLSINGLEGDDQIGVDSGVSVPVTVSGGAGNDSIQGSRFGDVLSGDAGNDTIKGVGGDDILRGGPGADMLKGGAGADDLFGNGGADTLKGNGGNDTLNGGVGSDELGGNAGDDLLIANDGFEDTLLGGEGSDTGVVDVMYDSPLDFSQLDNDHLLG